jgi:ferredoxin-type protein NapG
MISRRKFIKWSLEATAATALVGGFSMLPTRTYVRPPGAAKEGFFHQKCIKCGACVEVCPTQAVQQIDLSLDIKNLATPILNPEFGGCIAWGQDCLKCIKACPTDALSLPKSLPTTKLGNVVIDEPPCVNCMACFHVCPIEGAVLFPNPKGDPFRREVDIPTKLKMLNSPLKPYIDNTLCVGCGLCVHRCPVKVMTLSPITKKAAL